MLRDTERRWRRPDWSAVLVRDGIVQYRGFINSDDESEAARVAAKYLPGVRGVEDARMTGVP